MQYHPSLFAPHWIVYGAGPENRQSSMAKFCSLSSVNLVSIVLNLCFIHESLWARQGQGPGRNVDGSLWVGGTTFDSRSSCSWEASLLIRLDYREHTVQRCKLLSCCMCAKRPVIYADHIHGCFIDTTEKNAPAVSIVTNSQIIFLIIHFHAEEITVTTRTSQEVLVLDLYCVLLLFRRILTYFFH